MRTTLISVDLDDLSCYYAIHGLAGAEKEARGIVLEKCLPRFLELFAEFKASATFFVIGRELERDEQDGGKGGALLRQALEQGHELANHSFAHAYDMVTWSREAVYEDLRSCDERLRALGCKPVGFRAPGYTHDHDMLMQVAAMGYRYDSSSIPAPSYYFAKLGAMGMMRLRGRRSASMAGGFSTFTGGVRPRVLSGLGIWEVPVGVGRGVRLPLVGTFLLSGSRPVAKALRMDALAQEHVHLQFHGLDLADPDADGIGPTLRAHQPELKRSLKERVAAFRELLEARGGGSSIAAAFSDRGWNR
jgi:hypothetical protein